MAKKSTKLSDNLIVDRFLLIGFLLAAASYIMRGHWPSVFFEAGAIVIGVIWSYRAIQTNPSKEFRLLAALVFVLLTCLLTFYLASAHGLLPAVKI